MTKKTDALEEQGYFFSGSYGNWTKKDEIVKEAKKYRQDGYYARVIYTAQAKGSRSHSGGGYIIFIKKKERGE